MKHPNSVAVPTDGDKVGKSRTPPFQTCVIFPQETNTAYWNQAAVVVYFRSYSAGLNIFSELCLRRVLWNGPMQA